MSVPERPLSEVPPTLDFTVDWASPSDREEILAMMVVLGRQTMNLRVMPSAKLLCLRAVGEGQRIVAWAGFDVSFTPDMAEVFSLYVIPEYRTFLVGLLLETVRAAFLKAAGVARVLCRMEASSNAPLLRYRLDSGLMTSAPRTDVPAEALALCGRCELFGASCSRQAYTWVNVDRMLERGTQRLGRRIEAQVPLTITLDGKSMRRSVRPEQAPAPAGPLAGDAPALRSSPPPAPVAGGAGAAGHAGAGR